ncbi:class I SAM-dependent methyltransferase [Thiohalorhabdus sp. Cl-TMA]|uniref:Trans-aconitate 2-methyltransferase n=1 Tax=Thiohalorhabdus methylotrophus TaxID=3242694 RepID=A0ABV4TZN9_9GAMM
MADKNTETWESKLSRIGEYYSELVGAHGANPLSCDYGRPTSQKRKFGAVAEVMPLSGKHVLDVGCGLGDFADYLDAEIGKVQYTGVEIAPAMLKEARQLRPHLDLRQLDILRETPEGQFDLVTANGIFYLLGTDAKYLTEKIITRMFSLTRYAVAFTTLSTWTDYQESGEFYADPLETLSFCRTLTPWVVLRHDYAPHDFTVYLYKQSPFQEDGGGP